MTPLPDNPKVIVFPEFATRNGETKIVLNVATNVAPNTEVVFAKNEDDFRRAARGQPFLMAKTVHEPGD